MHLSKRFLQSQDEWRSVFESSNNTVLLLIAYTISEHLKETECFAFTGLWNLENTNAEAKEQIEEAGYHG